MRVPPWLRRLPTRLLAAVMAIVFFHALARSGSVSFFCTAMHAQRDEPCCPGEPPGAHKELRAARCACCELEVAPSTAPALAGVPESMATARSLAAIAPFSPPAAGRATRSPGRALFVPHTGPPRAELASPRSTVVRT